MKNFNTLYNMLMEAYGDNMRSKYTEQGIDENIVDSYIGYFNDFRSKKFKELFNTNIVPNIKKEQRLDISAYKNFHDLEQIVDYVRGQRQTKPTKSPTTETSDAKPIFEDDKIIIYRGMSPEECVAIKGNSGASWCVARDRMSGNMFNAYRYKNNQPTFYFVKDKNKDKTDKYHFFVLQKTKYNDSLILTSFKNDGDKEMSWDNVVKTVPVLNEYKEKFKNIPLTSAEEKRYYDFKSGLSDIDFKNLPLEEKKLYIDVSCNGTYVLTDNQFDELNFDLKNYYIGLTLPLTHHQFKVMCNDLKLQKRFVDIWSRYLSHPDVDYDLFVIVKFDKRDRLNFFKLCEECCNKAFSINPYLILKIPEDIIVDVVRMFKDSISNGIIKDMTTMEERFPRPYSIMRKIPQSKLSDIVVLCKEGFEKLFEKCPYAIIYIPDDKKERVKQLFPDINFSEYDF